MRFANAFDFAEAVLGDELRQRLARGLDRARGIGVGARLERVLAFQLQQRADADQNFCDLIFVHWPET